MPTDLVTLRRRRHNVTLYVGSDNEPDGRLFLFENGGHSLVIQAPELKLPGYTFFNEDIEADEMYRTTHYLDLQKIANLVKDIEFNKTNWCYLITRKDGSHRLRYSERAIRPISCLPWAPLILEEEIIYTKYLTAEDREGLWNGRVVNCMIGWNDRWRSIVDFSMRGHRLLLGLDVTFEVLGHIVRNGIIVGLMTEHVADDRRVEYCDRAAVYAAVVQVQSKGLIISLNESNIIIHKGKVRLMGMESVRKFSEVEDVDRAVANFHWRTLSAIFEELRQHSNLVVPLLRCFRSDPVPFIPVPSPEKPLGKDFFFRLLVRDNEDEMGSSSSVVTRKVNRPRRSVHPYTLCSRRLLLPPEEPAVSE
ncbi:hypothetical protein C8R46DRAFT_1106363 [Mycena filopes]|nr:hypothetical protein C8R46DRAFT_1106363 [Mycena filopes]